MVEAVAVATVPAHRHIAATVVSAVAVAVVQQRLIQVVSAR